jgi:hypothetical protein
MDIQGKASNVGEKNPKNEVQSYEKEAQTLKSHSSTLLQVWISKILRLICPLKSSIPAIYQQP